MNRREFLCGALAAGLAPAETRWALLADTHIPGDPANAYRGFRPQENLKKVIPEVLRYQPEGVVIDGDLARLEGLAGDYEALHTLLGPLVEQTPVALSLGNHDHRKNFLAVFDKRPASGRQPVRDKYVLVVDRVPVRLVILDSLMLPNVVPGLLGKPQRTWLEQHLQASDQTPTIVFVHHTLADNDDSLLDVDRLFRIVTPARKVKAIIYGHSHAYNYAVLEGIHLINIPAVGYNFRDSEPVGWVEARFAKEGADFKLRAIGGNAAEDGKVKSLSWR